jgi:hypothetical protein
VPSACVERHIWRRKSGNLLSLGSVEAWWTRPEHLGRDRAAPQRARPMNELLYTVAGAATVRATARRWPVERVPVVPPVGDGPSGRSLGDSGRGACVVSCGVPGWGPVSVHHDGRRRVR